MNERTRRSFLNDATAASALLLGACNRPTSTGANGSGAAGIAPSGPADVILRIGTVLADIAKEHTISTVGYNGSARGRLIRLREGVPVTGELFTDTDPRELERLAGHGHALSKANERSRD